MLLAGILSGAVEPAANMASMDPDAAGSTVVTMVTMTDAPGPRSPNEQTGTPLGSSVQLVVETKVEPAGSTVVRFAAVATEGPLFVTVTV